MLGDLGSLCFKSHWFGTIVDVEGRRSYGIADLHIDDGVGLSRRRRTDFEVGNDVGVLVEVQEGGGRRRGVTS